MNIFEEATRLNIRFATPRGLITTEDLWSLHLQQLDIIAVELHKKVEQGGTTSFIAASTSVDKTTELAFAVVKRVIEVQLAEKSAASDASANRAKDQRIMAFIAAAEDKGMAGKSVEELKSMLSTS